MAWSLLHLKAFIVSWSCCFGLSVSCLIVALKWYCNFHMYVCRYFLVFSFENMFRLVLSLFTVYYNWWNSNLIVPQSFSDNWTKHCLKFNFTLHLFFWGRDERSLFWVKGKQRISNFVSLFMQVLVYHDLLGMLQHPHHAKVFVAYPNLVFSFRHYGIHC